jgi:CRISPR-associated protein Cmr1
MTSLSSKSREWVLKARSPIWTGDVDRNGARTIPTGLLGSLRWWFEVLVRGLGGSACDPAESGRCPDKNDMRCVVCDLFGCTGWARKFRFDVLDENGKIKRDQIKKDETFRFRFTPLRPMRDEEWALLDLTLRLIADYGAIGGKTVLKPSEEASRQHLPHHSDYGIVQIKQAPHDACASENTLRTYLRDSVWPLVDHRQFAWASLENFWCVRERFLGRQSAANSAFNQVVGRKQPKQQGQQLRPGANEAERWLAGGRAESKKVFSFKSPPRTFGFVRPDLLTLDDVRKRLKDVWQDLKNEEFLTGPTVLDRLLPKAGGGTR